MDASTTPSGSDPRQLRREFQTFAEGTRRFSSPEEVLQTYITPLARIFPAESLPPLLRPHIPNAATSSSSQSVNGVQVDPLLVKSIQTSLLSRIVVDWSVSLAPQTLQDLAGFWFFGPPSLPSSSPAEVARGKVQQSALRTLTKHLSASTSSSSTVHPISRQSIVQLCIDALDRISLPSLISSIAKGERNKARAEVAWTETLRLLSSLPDRLANFTQGDLPPTFSSSLWIERVFVSGIAATLATIPKEGELRLLKDVLNRLDKMGYLTQPVDVEGRGFWSALLPHQNIAAQWPELRARLGAGLRLKLDRALVETLQYTITLRKGLPTGLVTAVERNKPGSEGVVFLSKGAQEVVGAVPLVLAAFLKPRTSSEDESESDSDSSPDQRIVSTFERIALPTPLSPLLGWGWTTYLSSTLPPSHLISCLRTTLERWSDATRISRSLREEEVYLTTLIVTLLASTSSQQAEQELGELSRCPTLLNGVSSHLSHSDPLFRRMGMLVAELISAATQRNNGEEEGGKKMLNFGSRVWNGRGEGREEARVLRGLVDGWAHHSEANTDIVKGWKVEGVAAAIRALGLGLDTSSKTAEREKELVREVKKREKAKVTRLPRRVDPPPRTKARALITMIDSDNEPLPAEKEGSGGPLKMFSRLQTTCTRSKSDSFASNPSSSDESDSDTPPESSETEIQRLAASLSGLSPSEAQHHLSSHPSSSPFPPPKQKQPRTKSSITDLDADTESHAPQFQKKIATPVYISQLAPLLKSSSRSSIRTALNHAARLIRLKSSTTHFGGEVRENAIDLTLSLVALHDNFGIKRFERLRREALVELAKAEAGVVVAVLSEQVFGSQYSGVQRGAMLDAIVESALTLSGNGGEMGEGEVGRRADKVVEGVIRDARKVGEEKVAAIRRQRNLEIHPSHSTRGKGLIQPHNPAWITLPSPAEVEGKEEQWTAIAGPIYFFPLLNRFLAYTAHHQTRTTFGAGAGALFQPETKSLLLDTLTILLPLLTRNATTLVDATRPLVEILSILLNPLDGRVGDGVGVDKASALNLLSVLLDSHLELDAGESLVRDQELVRGLRGLLGSVQELFLDLQNQAGTGGGGGVRGKVLSRCATILLLMDELDRRRQEALRAALGFTVPSN